MRIKPQLPRYSEEPIRNRRREMVEGTKRTLRAAEKEATGFIRDIRREGIRSGYQTRQTLQRYNPLRQTRRIRRVPSVIRGSRRTMTYEGPGLGERAVQEMSGGQHILDRDFFGSGEQRELIGQTTHDLTLGQKDKKQTKYY